MAIRRTGKLKRPCPRDYPRKEILQQLKVFLDGLRPRTYLFFAGSPRVKGKPVAIFNTCSGAIQIDSLPQEDPLQLDCHDLL
jgi:hypothetical protein